MAALPEGLAESARQIVQDGSELSLQHLAEQIYTLACKELSPEDLEQAVGKAEELKADLLVIASQDRRPVVARGLVDIDRLLGSSVSDYIRVHAPAPVLLVREPEGRS